MNMRRKRFLSIATCLLAAALSAGWASAQQSAPAVRIDMEQAIQLALTHNHALQAARSQVQQSQAEEITAAIRPNPVLSFDEQPGIPLSPGQVTGSNFNNYTEIDAGATFTWERGGKRPARVQAARDQTAVQQSQVKDNERTLTFSVAQQFLAILLAKSTLDFARQDLTSFQKTVDLSEERFKAGAISEGDLLKIKLQLLQFQTDVSSEELQLVQAKASLREFLGYESVPANYDVEGELAYTPLHMNKEDFQLMALKQRPDYLAAEQGVTAAQSQYRLARANGKRDLLTGILYSHTGGISSASFNVSIELPIWDRNQGEIARTHYAITQSEEQKTAAQEQVMTDVETAYETVSTGARVVQLYQSGYLKQAQDSRDISEYAYKRGAASLLDYLDAERSYRATGLAYRQSLATYMLAVEQLRESVGTRSLP